MEILGKITKKSWKIIHLKNLSSKLGIFGNVEGILKSSVLLGEIGNKKMKLKSLEGLQGK